MVAAGLSSLALTLLVTAEVLLRWTVGASTLVAEEWGAYLLVCIGFLGLGYTLRAGGLVQVELILNRLGSRSRRVARMGRLVAAAVVGVILGYWLWQLTAQSYRLGTTSNFISRTPLWIPQAFSVVGMSFFVLQVVAEMARAGEEATERRGPEGQAG